MRKFLAAGAALLALVMLSGCDRPPKHYFVLCDGKDGNGWALINTEMKDGLLIACTYQSPDRGRIYTTRCTDDGCGIQ